MKPLYKVFVDSDVVISSLISQKGAAYLLINNSDIQKLISTISEKELEVVIDRLRLNKSEFKELVDQKFEVIAIKAEKTDKYVFDVDDSHIVSGAKASKSKFLLTYNIKHYKIEKIKKELGIMVMRPAEFLQFLRSN